MATLPRSGLRFTLRHSKPFQATKRGCNRHTRAPGYGSTSYWQHGVGKACSGLKRALRSRAWRDLEQTSRFALLKVSFVPDHVHIALNVHPAVAPGPLVVDLMNAAQAVIWRDFSADAIQARIERLWQPSAYVGSYGDLATPQVQAYLRSHRSGESEAG